MRGPMHARSRGGARRAEQRDTHDDTPDVRRHGARVSMAHRDAFAWLGPLAFGHCAATGAARELINMDTVLPAMLFPRFDEK